MATAHAAERASLHVRVSNAAALRLYSDPPLNYSVEKTIVTYYADGEDAHLMRAPLDHLTEPSDFFAEATKAEQQVPFSTKEDRRNPPLLIARKQS